MKNFLKMTTCVVCLAFLAGCASQDELNSPCPNYGQSCDKTPVNSWNYKNV